MRHGCRDAISRHPVAAGLIRGGAAEGSYFAIDPETGALIKCRADYRFDGGMVIDVKSTEDASQSGFGKSAQNYSYDVQAAWYCDILTAHYGTLPTHFVFIAVEKTYPHAIGIYYVEPDVLAAGRVEARKRLDRIITWKTEGTWPDYGVEPKPLVLPTWGRRPVLGGHINI